MFQKKQQETPQFIPIDSHEFAHRRERAVSVPVEQSLWTGAIVFGTMFVIIYLLFDAGIYTSARIAGVLACVAVLAHWVVGQKLWRVDAKPDKPVVTTTTDNKPIKMVHVRHDHVNDNGHYSTSNYELPEGNWPNSLNVLAKGVLAGRPFTETEWAGPNKPFSIPDFRELRKRGINPKDPNRKLFVYKNSNAPQQGIDLTKKGRELFEELADDDRDEYVDG